MFYEKGLNLVLMVFYVIDAGSSTKGNSNYSEKINFQSDSLTHGLRDKILQKCGDQSSENKWLVEEFASCLL